MISKEPTDLEWFRSAEYSETLLRFQHLLTQTFNLAPSASSSLLAMSLLRNLLSNSENDADIYQAFSPDVATSTIQDLFKTSSHLRGEVSTIISFLGQYSPA